MSATPESQIEKTFLRSRVSALKNWHRSLPVLVIALFITALFLAKARDPFKRVEFSLRTASGGKVKGIVVFPRVKAESGKLGGGKRKAFPTVIYFHGSGGSLMNSGNDLRLLAEQGLAAVCLEYNQTNQAVFDEQFIALHEYLSRQKWTMRKKRKEEGANPKTFDIQETGLDIQPETAWVGFSQGAQRQLIFLLRHPEFQPQLLVRVSGGWIETEERRKAESEKRNAKTNRRTLGDGDFSAGDSQLPTNLHVLLVHGENDKVFPVADCRRMAELFQTNGATTDLRVFPGQSHAFGQDRQVVIRGIAEYCAAFLNKNAPDPTSVKKESDVRTGKKLETPHVISDNYITLRPLQINKRPLYLHYWIPAGLFAAVFFANKYLCWRAWAKASGIPQGKWSVTLTCVAWGLAIAAVAETSVRLGLPQLQPTERRLNLARHWFVRQPFKGDFDWLMQQLADDSEGRAALESTPASSPGVPSNVSSNDKTSRLVGVSSQQPSSQLSGGEGGGLAASHRDFTIGMLLEHLELAGLQRKFFYSDLSETMYREFILSPVVADNLSDELNWRRPLWESFYPRIRRETDPIVAAQIVIRFLRERVSVVPHISSSGIETIWQNELTDAAGFERIYVAALRAVGIAARLDDRDTAELFADGKWIAAPRPLISTFLPDDYEGRYAVAKLAGESQVSP